MSELTKFSLFKRSNGYYYVLFEEQGRRRWKSTGCTIKAEALKTLTNFTELFKEKPKAISLDHFESEFMDHAKVNHAKATVDIFQIALNHLKAVARDGSLSHLTPQHIDLYKTKRLRDGVSPVTVNVELRALRTMLNVAVRWQHLDANPFAKMKQISIPDRKPTFLTKEDFQALLNLVKETWLRELMVFAALTGMRRGEVLNLRWQNVDLERKVMHIETGATFKTKSGRRRVVPMNQTVFTLLCPKALCRAKDALVFTRNGRQIDASYLTHLFKDYVVKAGLDTGLHWHSLRHTFASWLVQDGVSLYEVQKLLGHSSMTVTQIYSHLQPEQLHRTVNRIQLSLN